MGKSKYGPPTSLFHGGACHIFAPRICFGQKDVSTCPCRALARAKATQLERDNTIPHDGSPELCGLSGKQLLFLKFLASNEKTAGGGAEDQGPLLELRANLHSTAVAVPVLADTHCSPSQLSLQQKAM